jgi:uncharacterized membrane protein
MVVVTLPAFVFVFVFVFVALEGSVGVVVVATVEAAWRDRTELFWLKGRVSDDSEGSLWLDSVDDRDSAGATVLATLSVGKGGSSPEDMSWLG